MPDFDRILSILLEDQQDSPLQAAIDIAQQLDEVQQKVMDLQTQLSMATDKMNGDVAMGVRKRHPSLNVGLDKNGCKIGYKTKHLLLSPDIKQRMWMVKSPDSRFVNKFSKRYAPKLGLSPDPTDLIDALANYFTGHYRSLGENISGTGLLIVDGKQTTLTAVAEWQDRHTFKTHAQSKVTSNRHGY